MARRFSTNYIILSILIDGIFIVLSLYSAAIFRPLFNEIRFVKEIAQPIELQTGIYVISLLVWIGILFYSSVYDVKKNTEFAESLELDYPILSDPDKSTAKAFGILKAMGMYAARNTFYIGADGKILYVDTDVNVKTAGADMVARLEALGVPKRQ